MSVYWPEARAARKGPLAIRGRRGRSRGPTRRLAPSASSSPRSRREPCNHIRAISRPTPSLLRRGNQSPPLCLGKSHPQPLDFQSMGKSDDGTAITSSYSRGRLRSDQIDQSTLVLASDQHSGHSVLAYWEDVVHCTCSKQSSS